MRTLARILRQLFTNLAVDFIPTINIFGNEKRIFFRFLFLEYLELFTDNKLREYRPQFGSQDAMSNDEVKFF